MAGLFRLRFERREVVSRAEGRRLLQKPTSDPDALSDALAAPYGAVQQWCITVALCHGVVEQRLTSSDDALLQARQHLPTPSRGTAVAER
jgi:hypothetical protein